MPASHRPDQFERIFDVSPPLLGGQPGLMRRIAPPTAAGQIERNPGFCGDEPADFDRLIEAALAVARLV